MSTTEEYRKYAEECFGWARNAKTDAERQAFLEMANVWMQAASLEDGKPPIVQKTISREQQAN